MCSYSYNRPNELKNMQYKSRVLSDIISLISKTLVLISKKEKEQDTKP